MFLRSLWTRLFGLSKPVSAKGRWNHILITGRSKTALFYTFTIQYHQWAAFSLDFGVDGKSLWPRYEGWRVLIGEKQFLWPMMAEEDFLKQLERFTHRLYYPGYTCVVLTPK